MQMAHEVIFAVKM